MGAGSIARRLFVSDPALMTVPIRRILALSGWHPSWGHPRQSEFFGIWANAPSAGAAQRRATDSGADVLFLDDAFLRAVSDDPFAPLAGLLIDPQGVHYDPVRPSRLEHILATDPLDDAALLDRARSAIERLRDGHLSQTSGYDPSLAPPPPGYVLVVDQPRGHPAVAASQAGPDAFREMLAVARIEHPGAPIYIKTDAQAVGYAGIGYFGPEHKADGTELFDHSVSPWHLLEGAIAVYTVSSHFGFEAILAGHRPRVFGQPFYGGWGLTRDERPVPRRERRLTRAQLAAAALFLAPTWYDPYRDRLCEIEDVLAQFEAQARAARDGRQGYVALAIPKRDRRALRTHIGPLTFAGAPAEAISKVQTTGAALLVRAEDVTDMLDADTAKAHVPLHRLTAPLIDLPGALAIDDLGNPHDPNQESRLERLIMEASTFPSSRLRRAEDMMRKLEEAASEGPDLPEGRRILVPGEDAAGARLQLGATGGTESRLALLKATRAQNKDAVLIYVQDEAAGAPAIPLSQLDGFADAVIAGAIAPAALRYADEVWTLTSELGFRALLQGLPVTCLGAPFYAGWGLTTDRAPVPRRRMLARPSVAAIAHAALIALPRYRDPETGLPCSPEVVLDRLTGWSLRRPTARARAQDAFFAWLARRRAG